MGVLANVAGDDAEDTMIVGAAIKAWFPTAVAAFSFLLFNLLDSPCLAAISTMAHEMQSRKWFWFAILFQNIFAYVVTLCVYQIGLVVTGAGFLRNWNDRSADPCSDPALPSVQTRSVQEPERCYKEICTGSRVIENRSYSNDPVHMIALK